MRNRITRHSWRPLSFPDHAICNNACQMCSLMTPSFPLGYSTVSVEVVLEMPPWSSVCGKQGTGLGWRWGHRDRWEALSGGLNEVMNWRWESGGVVSHREGLDVHRLVRSGIGVPEMTLALDLKEWVVVEPLWADQGDHRVLWMPLSKLSSHAPRMCSSLEVGLPLALGWHRGRAVDIRVWISWWECLRSLSWGGCGW